MPEKSLDAKERRKAQTREAVARHYARLAEMTPLERLAWKARKSLGEGFDPYTPEERERLARLKSLVQAAQDEAQALNRQVAERLKGQIQDEPQLVFLLAELETGGSVRVELATH